MSGILAYARARANRADCRVTVCPDTDGVAFLNVRGPAEQIVAVHDTLDAWTPRRLDAWARGLRSAGDERTTAQIMLTTLVERVTGLTHADTIDVEIALVMDAKTLICHDDEPAHLTGYGPRRRTSPKRSSPGPPTPQCGAC